MNRRFSAIYRDPTPALFCDKRLADRVGTTGVGSAGVCYASPSCCIMARVSVTPHSSAGDRPSEWLRFQRPDC